MFSPLPAPAQAKQPCPRTLFRRGPPAPGTAPPAHSRRSPSSTVSCLPASGGSPYASTAPPADNTVEYSVFRVPCWMFSPCRWGDTRQKAFNRRSLSTVKKDGKRGDRKVSEDCHSERSEESASHRAEVGDSSQARNDTALVCQLGDAPDHGIRVIHGIGEGIILRAGSVLSQRLRPSGR